MVRVDPVCASLGWNGGACGQPAKQCDANHCEQRSLGCSCCFHVIGLALQADDAERQDCATRALGRIPIGNRGGLPAFAPVIGLGRI